MSRRNQKKKHGFGVLVLLAALCLAAAGIVLGYGELQKASYPQKYSEYVEYYSDKYQMDPLMIYAVIRTESGFDPTSSNSSGARGLMQITETTFSWLKSKIAPAEQISYDDLFDPELNIRFGTYYWACCLARYENDLATASAAYYSGWGTVDELLTDSQYSSDGKTLEGFPYPKMNQYVSKVSGAYQHYQKLYQDE